MGHQIDTPSTNGAGAPPEQDPADTERDAKWDEQELKITVRKLEVPVRPRGVLAE